MRLMRRLVLIALLVGATTMIARAHAQQTIKFETINASPEALIIKLFKQAGENMIIEPLAPGTRRISVSLEGATFRESLNRICESAGLTWSEQGNVYIISRGWPSFSSRFDRIAFRSKGYPPFAEPFMDHIALLKRSFAPSVTSDLRPAGGSNIVYRTIVPSFNDFIAGGTASSRMLALSSEERSTFACPNCKKSVTIIGQKGACAKCNRTFQHDWAYCPFDGAKRTMPLDEWKVCPFCSKGVK